jgi:hypothetical protein
MWHVLDALTRINRRLVVLHGAKGVGTTQLATAVAHHVHLRRSERFFKDGVFMVKKSSADLSATAAPGLEPLIRVAFLVDSICANLSRALCSESGTRAPLLASNTLTNYIEGEEEKSKQLSPSRLTRRIVDKVAQFTEALASKSILLILDDQEESQALGDLLLQPIFDNTPNVQIIITSENLYHLTTVNFAQHSVEPLNERDSAILFSRQLNRKVLIDGEEADVVKLAATEQVKACGGNPLTIIQTARRLRNVALGATIVNLSSQQQEGSSSCL